jgi:hypothetical protein
MTTEDDRPTESPTDDVEYDEAALEDAKRKFHAGGHGGDEVDDDPTGGHDEEALEEGAERMGVERDS